MLTQLRTPLLGALNTPEMRRIDLGLVFELFSGRYRLLGLGGNDVRADFRASVKRLVVTSFKKAIGSERGKYFAI